VGSTVYWVSNATNDESIHQAAANGGTATVFTTVSDQGHIADGLFELVSDGASLFVASEYAAYSIPILANGTAGTPVTVVGGGTGMVVGEIAGRSNEFCGMWSGLSGIGYTCQTGGFNFFPGENPGPFVLPTCGIVFSTKYGTATQFVPHLVADRDLYTGQRSQQTLTTDDVGPLITDGTNVYFFETGGSIRWLPIP
jgi:hypothetical protein